MFEVPVEVGQVIAFLFVTVAVVVLSTFLVFAVIPMGPDLVVKDLDVGVFYALAVSSLSVIGVLMAGWASANKFALLGALRAAAQLIAYELPLLLAVVGVVVQAGTMNLQSIVLAQQNGSIFGFDGIARHAEMPYGFSDQALDETARPGESTGFLPRRAGGVSPLISHRIRGLTPPARLG